MEGVSSLVFPDADPEIGIWLKAVYLFIWKMTLESTSHSGAGKWGRGLEAKRWRVSHQISLQTLTFGTTSGRWFEHAPVIYPERLGIWGIYLSSSICYWLSITPRGVLTSCSFFLFWIGAEQVPLARGNLQLKSWEFAVWGWGWGAQTSCYCKQEVRINKRNLENKKNANIVRKRKVDKGSFIPYPAKEEVNLMNSKLILAYSHIIQSKDLRIFLKTQLRTWRLDTDAATFM